MIALPLVGLLFVGLLGDVAAAAPPASTPEPLDRVVAIVGEQPIFLSELRERARPALALVQAAPDPARRASARQAALRQLVEQMIDERLQQREAEKASLTVTPSEVDRALELIAQQAKLSREGLLAAAKEQGLSESAYRDTVRRQMLEQKLVQLRVRGRVTVTDADARKAYASWVKQFSGPNAPVDLRILVLRLPANASDADKKKTESAAAQIVSQARAGTDFCALVTKHSQDPTTTSACGSRGPMPRSALLPELAKATSALKPGEIAEPIALSEPGPTKSLVVVQRAPGAGPAAPSFESVKEQMKEHALTEALAKERREWIKELRAPAFIEVKL